MIGDVVLVKIVHKIVKPRFLDIVFPNTYKRAPGEVVFQRNFEWNGVIRVT